MCGIVGIGLDKTKMNAVMVKWFESMLLHDIVRGPHATGVYRGEANGISLYKDAVPSSMYLHTPQWAELKGEDLTPYQITALETAGKKIPAPLSNFYVGHNRYATMGAATDPAGAHPFHVGNVTLVHNGTLQGQWRLPDAPTFKVDSHNIAHSINKIGIADTVSKLQGAFTLIWHNQEDQTLNFLRNSQRPLWMVELATGGWVWCSESEMYDWLNLRRRAPFIAKRAFELPVGVQMIFDVSDGKFELKEEVIHELPTFQVARSTYNYGTNTTSHLPANNAGGGHLGKSQSLKESALKSFAKEKKTKTSPKSLKDLVDQKAKEAGVSVILGDIIPMTVFDFLPYSASVNDGRIRGYCIDDTKYYEAEAHGFTMEDFDKINGSEIYGVVQSAYIEDRISSKGADDPVLILILSRVANNAEDLDEGDEDDLETKIEEIFNKEAPPSEDKSENLRKRKESDLPFATDGEHKSSLADDEKKTLTNHTVAMKSSWKYNSLSDCGFCGNTIPWGDAEDVQTVGGITCCETCRTQLMSI